MSRHMLLGNKMGVLMWIGNGMWGCVNGYWEGDMVCMLMEIGKVCGECVNGDWEGDVVSVLMGIGKGMWWVC